MGLSYSHRRCLLLSLEHFPAQENRPQLYAALYLGT